MSGIKRSFLNFQRSQPPKRSVTWPEYNLGEEELPDLVVPSEKPRSHEGQTPLAPGNVGTADLRDVSGKAKVSKRRSVNVGAEGLEIKQSLKRKCATPLDNASSKRCKSAMDSKPDSPEVIDITADDNQQVFTDAAGNDDNIVLINYDGLDELAEGYDSKIIPDFLAKKIFSDVRPSAVRTNEAANVTGAAIQIASK